MNQNERICRGKKEREKETKRKTDTQKVSKRISRIEQGNQWQLSRSRRESTLLPVCHMIVFFFFFFRWAEQETTRSFYEREVYSAPRTLFEALLFTVDILTMINTFVYFFSKNFFSRPRGRGSIIDFVILGNYSRKKKEIIGSSVC